MQLVRKQSLALALLPALMLVLGSYAAAQPARAQSSHSNPIVATAMQYVGGHGGQCKVFVQTAVRAATGISIGPGYRQAFLDAGFEVNPADARAGDILQISNPSNHERYYPGYHTVIVVENHGNGRYTVVDSNWQWDERVRVHEWTPQPRSGLKLYAYRVGNGGSNSSGGQASVPVATAPDLDAGQSTHVDTGNGSRLNVRSGAGLGSSIIAQLNDGDAVTVLEKGGVIGGYTWVRVSSGSTEGWVASEFLAAVENESSGSESSSSGSESEPTPAPSEPPADAQEEASGPETQVAVVATDGSCLNLRADVGLNQRIITCMVDGTEVTVTSGETRTSDGYTWVPVSTPHGDGWVADEYLTFQ